mmetsp:Transcript_7268/g.10086  ORF Transcript_7268/g.10086 Transcript_7268/m.10086 type:complete len:270 (+) Transcript_7268:66-875(+)
MAIVLLDIEDNGYYFIPFGGVILFISIVVLVAEAKSEDDEILHIKPLQVFRNIILNQIGFYLMHLFITFTLCIASQDIINHVQYQVFSSCEFDFNTKRGLVTALSLTLAYLFNSLTLVAVVQTYKNMLDYCFTVFVIHFVVVSIVQQDFPASGSWWTATAIGCLGSMIVAERLSYSFETMTYQSSLGGSKPRKLVLHPDGNESEEGVELPQIQPEFQDAQQKDNNNTQDAKHTEETTSSLSSKSSTQSQTRNRKSTPSTSNSKSSDSDD